ncbi:MAG: cytochrome C oxidase subunit IV family protein [Actinomycetota bacterium]
MSDTEAGTDVVLAEGGTVATVEPQDVVVAHDTTHAHPSPRQYVLIAVVLCILTAIEVGLYYLEGDVADNLLIAMLAVLAFVKFFLVAAWYMHMKVDMVFFRRTFIVGIALACFVYGVALFTFASTVLSS